MVLEKKHRLDLSYYEGMARASFTICIKHRKPIFTQPNIVKIFTNTFESSIRKHNCINWIYLFMPDHFHFVLEGARTDANLWRAVVLFKQRTGCWFSKNIPSAQWQKDFFDYVHRKDDDLKKHIYYILDNPVRKGIVKNWDDYPYKGSLDWDLQDII